MPKSPNDPTTDAEKLAAAYAAGWRPTTRGEEPPIHGIDPGPIASSTNLDDLVDPETGEIKLP